MSQQTQSQYTVAAGGCCRQRSDATTVMVRRPPLPRRCLHPHRKPPLLLCAPHESHCHRAHPRVQVWLRCLPTNRPQSRARRPRLPHPPRPPHPTAPPGTCGCAAPRACSGSPARGGPRGRGRSRGGVGAVAADVGGVSEAGIAGGGLQEGDRELRREVDLWNWLPAHHWCAHVVTRNVSALPNSLSVLSLLLSSVWFPTYSIRGFRGD